MRKAMSTLHDNQPSFPTATSDGKLESITSINTSNGTYIESSAYLDNILKISEISDEDLEKNLIERFEPERISELASEYLACGTFGDIREMAAGKKFVMGVVKLNDPQFNRFADLGIAPEILVFSNVFGQSMASVRREYAPTDSRSTMLFVLQTGNDEGVPIAPKIAGSIRLVEGPSEEDHKSIKDLVVDSPDNPWLEEIKMGYFTKDGKQIQYDESLAWRKLCRRAHVRIEPNKAFDVATLSVLPDYGSGGDLDSVRQRLYHSCFRHAIAYNKKYLVSIQDTIPFEILQGVIEPFDTFEGLKPHEYPKDYPYPTIPAFCRLGPAQTKARKINEVIAKVFIEGAIIRRDTLLLQDQAPEIYRLKTSKKAKLKN